MEEGMMYDIGYWQDQVAGDNKISRKDAAEIMQDLSFHDRLRLADSLTSLQAGDTVGYAVSYNINYSNYCAASCPICAFYVPAKLKGRTDKGYELSEDDVRKKLGRPLNSGKEWLSIMEEAHELGIRTSSTMMFGHVETSRDKADHLLSILELQKVGLI